MQAGNFIWERGARSWSRDWKNLAVKEHKLGGRGSEGEAERRGEEDRPTPDGGGGRGQLRTPGEDKEGIWSMSL